MAKSGMGQLGDLSGMAQGQGGQPTGQDQQLIAASIGRARQLAEEQMKQAGTVQGSQLRERLTSRGVQGSSSEVAENLLQSLGTQGGINQSILQAQQSGGEALMNLPFMRGQQQLQANQALFQRILQSASPVLQAGVMERLAQTTTQTHDPAKVMSAFQGLGAGTATLIGAL